MKNLSLAAQLFSIVVDILWRLMHTCVTSYWFLICRHTDGNCCKKFSRRSLHLWRWLLQDSSCVLVPYWSQYPGTLRALLYFSSSVAVLRNLFLILPLVFYIISIPEILRLLTVEYCLCDFFASTFEWSNPRGMTAVHMIIGLLYACWEFSPWQCFMFRSIVHPCVHPLTFARFSGIITIELTHAKGSSRAWFYHESLTISAVDAILGRPPPFIETGRKEKKKIKRVGEGVRKGAGEVNPKYVSR